MKYFILKLVVYQLILFVIPALRKWEQKSLSFSKYFSTATSTLMTMSDMAYGGMLQNEPCESLADGLRKYCYQESFLDRLKKIGYQVKVVGYPIEVSDDVIGSNQRHLWDTR